MGTMGRTVGWGVPLMRLHGTARIWTRTATFERIISRLIAGPDLQWLRGLL